MDDLNFEKQLHKKMKTIFKIIPILFFVGTFGQSKKCNYIEDYYPLVYRGQLSYLKKQNDSAYFYLKQAEKNCGLLYNSRTNEIGILADLETEKKNYSNAFKYIRMLLENGNKFSDIEEDETFKSLKSKNNWQKLKSESDLIYKNWYQHLNLDLRNEIVKMTDEDQRVRTTKVSKEEFERIDSINENRFKEIFKTYGYPTQNLIGNWSLDQKNADVLLFAFHFKDIEYFKPLFFDFVKNGQAEPELYAGLIDSHDRNRGIFTYRIYSNLTDEQIEDLPNLDKRRVSVGLRPWKMELEYIKLRGF